MATAVLLARDGKGFAAKPEDLPTCESLAARGYVRKLEDGVTLAVEFALAIGINAAKRAEAAENN